MRLEALQAKDGDCLLLHYGTVAKPGIILIDGGSRGVYREVLENRLDQLRGGRDVLDLRLVVISHIDADHITGIVDMFRKMSDRQENGQQPPWKVKSLWHNAFEKTVGSHSGAAQSATVAAASSGSVNIEELKGLGLQDPKARAVVASVRQGKDLQRLAPRLTKINAEMSGGLVLAPDIGRKDIKIDASLTFTIVGPHQSQINDLAQEWRKVQKAKVTDQAAAADYLNRTVPNLSSIVFVAEEEYADGASSRMLFTGDAGGDLVLEGLEKAGLLDVNGQITVDVLKIQHHGSKHSVEPSFFERVRAKSYVISGNGAHGIPNMEVLEWLSEARKSESFDVYMTNRRMQDRDRDYTPDLDKFLEDKPLQHCYHFREENELSIMVR